MVAGQDVVLQSLLAVGFALIGMCMGSFASAIAARAPAGQSWISSKGKAERSRCPVCGHVLSWKDLIPLLSWISTLGKCRYCRTKISPLYPALELLGASVAVGVFLQGGAEGVGWDIAFRMAALPFAIANLVMVARRQKDLLTISLACFFMGVAGIFEVGQGGIGGYLLLAGAACGGAVLLLRERVAAISVLSAFLLFLIFA